MTVWIAIGIISGLIIGEGAGILAWLSGDKVPAAILAGGGAFVATITVVVLIIGLYRRGRLAYSVAPAGAGQDPCPVEAKAECRQFTSKGGRWILVRASGGDGRSGVFGHWRKME